MTMTNMNGDEVIRFERPFRCVDCPTNGCYPDKTQVIITVYGDKFGFITFWTQFKAQNLLVLV